MKKEISGLHHISIKTTNLQESIKFYTELLGLKLKYDWADDSGKAVLIDSGDGNYIELWFEEKSRSTESVLAHFALRVNSIESLVKRLRENNIEITMDVRGITIPSEKPLKAKIAFCKGPSGESIEFFEEFNSL
ncbi:MAG: VOC family protein [bacterium]|nr:VOC family protein [bacterium]